MSVTAPNTDQSTSVFEDAKEQQKVLHKAAIACFMGNFVEWFDYAAYGYLASVIAAVFFPEISPTASLLATWGVFAISFFIRPIGGVVWGHFGDKFGRRWALSMSIVIMSGATFLIAFLPTYEQVGLLAPVALLFVRIVQGFSASGEYAGASAFISEYAPNEKRGLYTSIVPGSTAVGLLFGSLLVTLLTTQLGDAAMESYGWRLPFLLAAPLGFIGWYIRIKLEDTPKFRELTESEHVTKTPFLDTLTTYWKAILITLGVACLNAVGFYTILSYMPTYLMTQVSVTQSQSFIATTFALIAYIALIFLMGHLSDRFGRKPMLITASVLFIALTVPLFSLFGQMSFVGIVLIQITFATLLAMNDGTLACFLSETFPTKVRYTGFGFSFNTANAVFGGAAPFIATWLIAVSGNELAPGWYLTVAAVVALIAILMGKETAGRELEE